MPSRICIECGRPIPPTETRCSDHRVARRSLGRPWRRLRKAILERDGYLCAYCGGRANSVDHVVPVDRGGSNDPSNLVAACGTCNSSKQGKSRSDFERGLTDEHRLRRRLRG